MLHSSIRSHITCIALVTTYLCSSISLAGPPTGPSKKNCKNALSAINIQNINFGEFDASTGGTVTIATDGTRTATGGIILTGGTTTAAIFEVNSSLPGCEAYPVTIKAPNNTTLTEPLGSTLVANGFTTLPASGFTIIPGTPTLVEVGADLTVPAAQAGGTYDTLAPFTLTFR